MKDEEGILVSSDGPDVNVIKLKPPMVFNRANADRFLKAFKRMISDIRTQRLQLLWFTRIPHENLYLTFRPYTCRYCFSRTPRCLFFTGRSQIRLAIFIMHYIHI